MTPDPLAARHACAITKRFLAKPDEVTPLRFVPVVHGGVR